MLQQVILQLRRGESMGVIPPKMVYPKVLPGAEVVVPTKPVKVTMPPQARKAGASIEKTNTFKSPPWSRRGTGEGVGWVYKNLICFFNFQPIL